MALQPKLSSKDIIRFPGPNRLPDPAASLLNPDNPPDEEGANLDREALFESLCERFIEGRDSSEEWRDGAVEDYDFAAGRQYSAKDREIAEKLKRPMIVYDRVGRNVAAVCGLETNNRMEAAAFPREPGDVQKSEIGTSLLAWVDDTVQAPEEDSEAFRDMVVCGVGITDTNMNYLTWSDGMPETLRVSPLIYYWDPHAKRRNLVDRTWDAIAKSVPIEQARRIAPGWDDAMLHADWAGIDDDLANLGAKTEVQTRRYDSSDRSPRDRTRKRVTMIEIQWRETRTVYLVENLRTGSQRELAPDIGRQLVESLPDRYAGIEREAYVYYRAILGATLLKKDQLDAQKAFTRNVMTGYRDETTGDWYGLVRAMKDPQRAANSLFSQSVAIMRSSAKNGYFVEKTAVENMRQFEQDQAKPGANVLLRDGGLQKIMPIQAPNPPAHVHELLTMSLGQVQESVGIPLEAVAMATGHAAGQTALLESERRKAGMNILANFFAAKRSHLQARAKLVLRYIHEFMRDGRLVRVAEEGAEKYIQLWLDDQDVTLYDVMIDDAPTSPDARERVWLTLQALFPVMQSLGTPPEIFVKILPYIPHMPAALITEIMKVMEPSPEKQTEAEQQKQLMQRAQEAEVAKTEGQAAKEASAAALNQAKVADMGGRLTLDASEQARETSLALASPTAIPFREIG